MTTTAELNNTVKACPICGGAVRLATRFDGYGHLVPADRLRHLQIRGLAR